MKIHKLIEESIVEKDKTKLSLALGKAYRDGIDSSYIPVLSKLLPETWHDEHEDLINEIYLGNLNDDIFTDPIYRIAMEPRRYRKYDDETESTLRKCIHALKMINSHQSNFYIEALKKTKNENIGFVLEMYNK